MVFAKIAEQVWALPKGTHEHCGFRSVRNPNNVLLFIKPKGYYGRQAELLSTNGTLNQLDKKADILHIIAYPNPKHHEAFAEQSKLNCQGGYSEEYPKAIGTLSVGIDSRKGVDALKVNYAQSHMAGSRNISTKFYLEEGEWPAKGLSRSMREKYAGWRERAFRELIRLAIQKNKSITVSKKASDLKRQFAGNDQLLRDIKTASEKEGVKINNSDEEVRILTGG